MASWNNPNYTPKKLNNINLGGLYDSIKNARFSWWTDEKLNKYKGILGKSLMLLARERRSQYPSNLKMKKTVTNIKSNPAVNSNLSITRTTPDTSNWKDITTDSLTKGLDISNQNKTTSFRDAFNKARAAGLREFTWGGSRYNTRRRGEENYSWDEGSKRWINPIKNSVSFTTKDIAPMAVPKETPEIASTNLAANVLANITKTPDTISMSNQSWIPSTATPTFVGQTNNNWLRDMFKDSYRLYNFG